ncbi:MAG: bifunctional DNA primase/polymerase [Planctomycetes bacterium]|nr:bifunctional DNA primase/polymerase [Planctomycetota bacterium]
MTSSIELGTDPSTYDADVVFKGAAAVAARGWKVVRLYGLDEDRTCECGRASCPTPGKHPVGFGWPEQATSDEETIAAWCEGDERINVGLLLGQSSGVIDVECDSPEAEVAARGYGLDRIETPSYRSSRGVHRLFQWEPGFPDQAVVKVDGVEVRLGSGGSAAQSVIPPSMHRSGVRYTWLPGKSPEDLPPARLPDGFRRAMLEQGRSKGCAQQAVALTASGEPVSPGGRHAYLLGEASYLAFREPDLNSEVSCSRIVNILHGLNETKCKPPKDKSEVEQIARDQIEFYRRAREAGRPELRSTDPHAETLARTHRDPWVFYGLEKRDGLWFPGKWRLVVVHGDPKHYRLMIPNPAGVETFSVILTPDEYLSPQKVANRILASTGLINVCDPTPAAWAKVWSGFSKQGTDVRGLQAQLMAGEFLTEEDPPPEEKRYAIVAGHFLDELSRANTEINELAITPGVNGSPKWLWNNGRKELWFNYSEVLKQIREWTCCEVTPGDWRDLRKRIQSFTGEDEFLTSQSSGGTKGRKRYFRWDERHLDALRKLAGVVSV